MVASAFVAAPLQPAPEAATPAHRTSEDRDTQTDRSAVLSSMQGSLQVLSGISVDGKGAAAAVGTAMLGKGASKRRGRGREGEGGNK